MPQKKKGKGWTVTKACYEGPCATQTGLLNRTTYGTIQLQLELRQITLLPRAQTKHLFAQSKHHLKTTH